MIVVLQKTIFLSRAEDTYFKTLVSCCQGICMHYFDKCKNKHITLTLAMRALKISMYAHVMRNETRRVEKVICQAV